MSMKSLSAPTRDATNAAPVRLGRGEDRVLRLLGDGDGTAVSVRRCFPWEQPMKFLSLCDKDGNEVVLIEDLAALDSDSRRVLEEQLSVVGFTLAVSRISSIEKEIEIRNWTVVIDGVRRTFQTELDEWPRRLNDGTVLIRDVAGDLYTIRRPDELDRHSHGQLASLLDQAVLVSAGRTARCRSRSESSGDTGPR